MYMRVQAVCVLPCAVRAACVAWAGAWRARRPHTRWPTPRAGWAPAGAGSTTIMMVHKINSTKVKDDWTN